MMPAFFLLHTAILLALFAIPKLIKVEALAGVDHLGALLPDLMGVPLAEGVILGLVLLMPGRWGRGLSLLWGLLLGPIALVAVAEHRFFSATGSLLDLSLLAHGMGRLGEIQGLIGAELTWPWALITALTLPLGIAMAWMGRRVSGRARLLGAPLALISFGLLSWVLYWGGTLHMDPRLVAIRVNWLGQMAMDGLRLGRLYELPEREILDLEHPLPEPLTLGRAEGEGDKPLPNVVLVILESVRASATTPYHPDLPTTPYLDTLAKEGWRVESAYTTMPHTTKSLVPLLCGVPPDIRRPLTETSPGAIPVPCLAQLLRPLGYRTGFFQPATEQFEQRPITVANAGFELFVSREDLDRRRWEAPNYLGVEDRALLEPALKWAAGEPIKGRLGRALGTTEPGDDGPFFLTILTLITHHDYQVPSDFETVDYGADTQRINDYFNTIRYTDDFIKELVIGLEAQGHLDDTLFIFVGDHGEGHGEHGRMGHDAILYQEGLQVPWILWGPGVLPEPRVILGPRQNSDLVATVADLLGLQAKTGALPGIPLSQDVGDRTLFFSCWYEDRCIGSLQGDEKLIFYYNRYPTEVFNVRTDPLERDNRVVDLTTEDLESRVNAAFDWQFDVRSLYATHQSEVSRNTIFFELPELKNPIDGTFGSKLKAVGYTIDGPSTPGAPFSLGVYFDVLGSVGWYWKFELDLVDALGKSLPLMCRSSEDRHPAYTWVPGRYYRAQLDCRLPGSTAPGEGTLRLGFGGYGARQMPAVGEDVDSSEDVLLIPITVRE